MTNYIHLFTNKYLHQVKACFSGQIRTILKINHEILIFSGQNKNFGSNSGHLTQMARILVLARFFGPIGSTVDEQNYTMLGSNKELGTQLITLGLYMVINVHKCINECVMHNAWPSYACMMRVDLDHIESCLKVTNALGQEKNNFGSSEVHAPAVST